jgi:alpha/beta superfamily hydrolase
MFTGQGEFPAVIRMASERLGMLKKAGNPLSEQIVVPDSDHYFHDRGASLLEVVSTWLNRLSGSKGWVK